MQVEPADAMREMYSGLIRMMMAMMREQELRGGVSDRGSFVLGSR